MFFNKKSSGNKQAAAIAAEIEYIENLHKMGYASVQSRERLHALQTGNTTRATERDNNDANWGGRFAR